MAFKVPAGKKLRYTYQFLKADGTPGGVDGTPEIQTTLGTVMETVAAPLDANDTTNSRWSSKIDPAGVGDGSVSGTADVDRGAGVKPLAFLLGDFTVEELQADHISVGDPVVED
jgi:hypothetical protein